MCLAEAHALDRRLEFDRCGEAFGFIVPDLDLVDDVSVVDKKPVGAARKANLVLRVLGLLPSSD